MRCIDFCIPPAETFTGIRARRWCRWCAVWRALKCAANPPTLVVPSRARRTRASGCTANGGGPRRSRSSCARRYSIIGPHLRRTQSDRYLFVIRDLACTIRSWRRALSTTTRHALGDILSHNEVNQLRNEEPHRMPNPEERNVREKERVRRWRRNCGGEWVDREDSGRGPILAVPCMQNLSILPASQMLNSCY